MRMFFLKNRPVYALFTALLLTAATGAWAQPECSPESPLWTSIDPQGRQLYNSLGIGWDSTIQDSGDHNANGMVDKYEATLVEKVLCDPSRTYHTELGALWVANYAKLQAEPHYLTDLAQYELAIMTLVLIDPNTADLFERRLGLTQDYEAFTVPGDYGAPFSWYGDYDGDGSRNFCEYQRVIDEERGPLIYVNYVTNPAEAGAAGCDPFPVPDYCTAVNTIGSNNTLYGLLSGDDDKALLALLFCRGPEDYCATASPKPLICDHDPPYTNPPADFNGGIDPDLDLPIPNGMPDAEYELGLIRAVLADPSLDLSSGQEPGQVRPGVRYLDVALAVPQNRAQLKADLGDQAIALLKVFQLSALADSLLDLLGGFMTIGNEDSAGSVLFLFGILEINGNAIAANPNPDIRDYSPLPEFFAFDGDADGDGYCNRSEFDEFYQEGNPSAYVAAALDPMIKPSGPMDCPGVEFAFEGYVYNPANGHLYTMTSTPGTWASDRAAAEAHAIGDAVLPGYLVVINDAAENQFLVDNGFLGSERYIGLYDPNADNAGYEWVNGDPLSYTNWRGGEPNDRTQTAVNINTDGTGATTTAASSALLRSSRPVRVFSASMPTPTISRMCWKTIIWTARRMPGRTSAVAKAKAKVRAKVRAKAKVRVRAKAKAKVGSKVRPARRDRPTRQTRMAIMRSASMNCSA